MVCSEEDQGTHVREGGKDGLSLPLLGDAAASPSYGTAVTIAVPCGRGRLGDAAASPSDGTAVTIAVPRGRGRLGDAAASPSDGTAVAIAVPRGRGGWVTPRLRSGSTAAARPRLGTVWTEKGKGLGH